MYKKNEDGIEIKCANCRNFWRDHKSGDTWHGYCDEFAVGLINEHMCCDGAAFHPHAKALKEVAK